MKAKNKNYSDFTSKVIEGLKLSYKKMIQDKIAKDQSVVMMYKGKMIKIKAADVCNLK